MFDLINTRKEYYFWDYEVQTRHIASHVEGLHMSLTHIHPRLLPDSSKIDISASRFPSTLQFCWIPNDSQFHMTGQTLILPRFILIHHYTSSKLHSKMSPVPSEIWEGLGSFPDNWYWSVQLFSKSLLEHSLVTFQPKFFWISIFLQGNF